MRTNAIFKTPIWITKYENFEEEKDKILTSCNQYKIDNPKSEVFSNRGGYQSPKSLHSKKELRNVFDFICSVSMTAADSLKFSSRKTFICSSWVNYNETKQSINFQHLHDGVFSGVFYIKVPEGSGKLIIINPQMNFWWEGCRISNLKNKFTVQDFIIDPKEGQLIIWPSYLEHFVEPNICDQSRVSISFNIYMKGE